MHHPPGINNRTSISHKLRHPSQNMGSIYIPYFFLEILLQILRKNVDKVGQFQFLTVINKCLFEALGMLPRTLSFVFFGRVIPFYFIFWNSLCSRHNSIISSFEGLQYLDSRRQKGRDMREIHQALRCLRLFSFPGL